MLLLQNSNVLFFFQFKMHTLPLLLELALLSWSSSLFVFKAKLYLSHISVKLALVIIFVKKKWARPEIVGDVVPEQVWLQHPYKKLCLV